MARTDSAMGECVLHLARLVIHRLGVAVKAWMYRHAPAPTKMGNLLGAVPWHNGAR
jgi:hypothetical protein